MKFGKRLLKEIDEVRRSELSASDGRPPAPVSGILKSRFYVDYRELKKKIKMI